MEHVLLAIDRDESRATVQAETIADLFDTANTAAHLFHAFSDNPEGASITQLGSVRRATDVLEAAGISVEHHEGTGDPTEEILRTANDLDVDAICIAGRKRSATGKLVFGSITQDVILNTERPVVVCGTSEMED